MLTLVMNELIAYVTRNWPWTWYILQDTGCRKVPVFEMMSLKLVDSNTLLDDIL